MKKEKKKKEKRKNLNKKRKKFLISDFVIEKRKLKKSYFYELANEREKERKKK